MSKVMKRKQIKTEDLLPIIRSASAIGYPSNIDCVEQLQKDLRDLIDLVGYDRIEDIRGGLL